MNKVVLDASAVLALLNCEPGHEVVEKQLANGVISAVNLSEVVTILTELGISCEESATITGELIKEVVDFDHAQALLAAGLRKITKSHGLSLGDRACLALAKFKNLPVLTANKAWHNINHGIKVLLIR